jgi:putative flippase GtrA
MRQAPHAVEQRRARRRNTSTLKSVVRHPRALVGWFLVGLIGALLELLLLRTLVELANWPLPLATAAAAETLIVAKFLTADRFVFGHPKPTYARALKYHGASAGALVVYWLVINALSLFQGVPYVIGFIIGTGAAFAWSLLTNFLWVWAVRR